jgi:hypothetical protein
MVEADGWLFVTGQLATDPDDDSLPLPDCIEASANSRWMLDQSAAECAARRTEPR